MKFILQDFDSILKIISKTNSIVPKERALALSKDSSYLLLKHFFNSLCILTFNSEHLAVFCTQKKVLMFQIIKVLPLGFLLFMHVLL